MSQEPETGKLDRIAQAHDTHQDFDGVLARFTGKMVVPHITGLRVLEAGCASGVMTPALLAAASELDVVEGSPVYAEQVEKQYAGKLKMIRSFFEDYKPQQRYEAVVLANVLHHLDNPVDLLKHIAGAWMKKGSVLHLTVPNMTSFHRQLGVAMKVSASVKDASERNVFFAQPGRYDKELFSSTVEQAGLRVEECTGFFFKPFPHGIMNSLDLSNDILEGLFEMGKQYPEMACQLYIRATIA